jgi:N-acetylglucosamine-6-phosphate deacetylase
LIQGSRELGQFGTTTVLPTLYRIMQRATLAKLREVAEAIDQCRDVHIPGFHLEGPFLALPGAGADTVPGDLTLLKEMLDAAMGRVAAMSISPDTPNILPVIEHLVEQRIVPFITHTRASVEQTQRALDAGARHATHFYDVFPLPQETEPGVRPCGTVEAILADKRASVDFVGDGVHVHPIAIKAALAAKGYEKVLLITDSNIGAGLPKGIYQTDWGYPVKVEPGNAARIEDTKHPSHGCLAGSALTMNVGMANLLRWLDLPAAQVWAMGTRNVAACMGWPNKGVIGSGADADFVLWDEHDTHWQPHQTWLGGRCVFDSHTLTKDSTR